MISIICVYNNRSILDEFLLKSLAEQTSQYELILIDNSRGAYRSAAEALNWGGIQAKGKYLMFVHQDVSLESKSWLDECESILNNIPQLGIAGVAGMSENGRNYNERTRNIIKHGYQPNVSFWGNRINKPELVQTLDECLFIIPNTMFLNLKFDVAVCDNWHLYAVDYCISCIKFGGYPYVIPMSIWHKSKGPTIPNKWYLLKNLGPLPKPFYNSLKRLITKHNRDIKHIYTTSGDFNTYCPLILQRFRTTILGELSIIKNMINK